MTQRADRKRPQLEAVLPRVEFGPGTSLTLETDGEPPETFDLETVSLMFAVGVSVPERTRFPESPSNTRLVLNGPARFLVGTLDVGAKRGMNAVRRGLEEAIDVGARDLHEQQSAKDAPALEDGPVRWRATSEPDEGERPHVIVTVEDFGESIDELLEKANAGTDVIITRGGVQVAALVGWAWYARQREHLARLAVAHWAAWRTGRFDSTAYAKEVAALRTSRLEQVGGPRPSAVGAGDDNAD